MTEVRAGASYIWWRIVGTGSSGRVKENDVGALPNLVRSGGDKVLREVGVGDSGCSQGSSLACTSPGFSRYPHRRSSSLRRAPSVKIRSAPPPRDRRHHHRIFFVGAWTRVSQGCEQNA
ncbi:unnamed protein product [Linum trigynum]|uniref:Uncharacterized protein n=1 Tax=Linum trigynum TaxID=586398 RepID=A0AAV2FDC0_9ROSI